MPGCMCQDTPWEPLRSCKTIVMFRLRRFTAGCSVRCSAVTLSQLSHHLRLLWSFHSMAAIAPLCLWIIPAFETTSFLPSFSHMRDHVSDHLLPFSPHLHVLFLSLSYILKKKTNSLVKGRPCPRTPPRAPWPGLPALRGDRITIWTVSRDTTGRLQW